MAQKLLLRPFLSLPLKQLSAPLRPQPTWLLCRPTTAPSGIAWRTPLPFTTMPATRRTFSTTLVSQHTFNIQDGDDFQDRVLKSQTPVVIDFHAHNPVRWAKRLGRIFQIGHFYPFTSFLKHHLTAPPYQDFSYHPERHFPPSLAVYRWCGPCKILGPRLEKVVAKHNGKVLMAKVDIDDHTDLALEYEVSAVPTVLAMKNGDVVDKFVGIKDEDQLEAFLKKLIGP